VLQCFCKISQTIPQEDGINTKTDRLLLSIINAIGQTMKLFTIILLLTSMFTSLVGCGTLLHPEQKGQTGGRIDSGIVIQDGIGLLFFFIPGAIAFAVDFSYGTIYLPGGRSASLNDEQLKQLSAGESIDLTVLESIIKQDVGHDLTFGFQNIQITQLSSTEQLPKAFLIPAN
jgi:hypothetical protein